MKIIFYREKCIGCNSCVENASGLWFLSEKDGKACLRDSKRIKNFFSRNVGIEDEEEAKQASEHCPVNIIKIS